MRAAAALVTLVLAAASGARAQDTVEHPSATLEFLGAPGTERCSSRDAFADGVASRLGYDPFVEATDRHVRVVLDDTGHGRLRLEIEILRGASSTGARTFEGRRAECEMLIDSAVFAVSLAIDPSALTAARAPSDAEPTAPTASPPEPTPSPGPTPRPEPSVEPTSVPAVIAAAPEPTTTSPDALRIGIHIGITGSLGASIAVATGGAAIGAEIGWRDLRVLLTLRGDVPTSGAAAGGSVEANLLGGELAGCGLWSPVMLCGVVFAGALRGQGAGFTPNREVWLPHVGLGGRIGLEGRLFDAVSLRVQLDLMGHLTPARLQVDEIGVWAIAPVSGVLALLAVVRLE